MVFAGTTMHTKTDMLRIAGNLTRQHAESRSDHKACVATQYTCEWPDGVHAGHETRYCATSAG